MTEKKELEQLYKPGKPEEPLNWLKKFSDQQDMIKYLRNAERYWYGESFGSEKRKSPA
ncbi:MAG: hypothetical protein NC831_03775 [Candidatus Omnitrophica bacterium]|nr:hypothetical protein [Candidatus Omnitrophota bacterium]